LKLSTKFPINALARVVMEVSIKEKISLLRKYVQ